MNLLPLRIRSLHLLLALYALLAAAAAFQAVALTRKAADREGNVITRYNNYVIFRASHDHLLQGKNLYGAYPEEHWDLFKYSPTFALAFGVFALFPDWAGLGGWNLLNALIFFLAIRMLPVLNDRQKIILLLLSVADAMTSLQNSQSNLLMAGLILLGFSLFERGRPLGATLCLTATFYIKLFGLAALIILLFYPEKRKSILYALGWMVVLFILPLPVTGWEGLAAQYLHYLDMLRSDHAASVGLSVMGGLKRWFGADVPHLVLILVSFSLLCLPLFRPGRYGTFPRRALFLSGLMVWMVIFNHKAESPTFIIATAGVWLWFLSRPRTPLTLALVILVFLFTSLAATDLWPRTVRVDLFEPWLIKAVPCILVWLWMVWGLWQPDRAGHPDGVPLVSPKNQNP